MELLFTSAAAAMSAAVLSETVRRMTDGKETLLAPVLKCVAAAVVTQIAADLCRDASQSALASAVELCGALFALGISMPLIVSMLKMLGGLL